MHQSYEHKTVIYPSVAFNCAPSNFLTSYCYRGTIDRSKEVFYAVSFLKHPNLQPPISAAAGDRLDTSPSTICAGKNTQGTTMARIYIRKIKSYSIIKLEFMLD